MKGNNVMTLHGQFTGKNVAQIRIIADNQYMAATVSVGVGSNHFEFIIAN